MNQSPASEQPTIPVACPICGQLMGSIVKDYGGKLQQAQLLALLQQHQCPAGAKAEAKDKTEQAQDGDQSETED